MAIIIYMIRCIVMLLVTWTGIRLIGKKSIAQLTSYDFAAIILLTTVAAEPLVFKVTSKASVGTLTLAFGAVLIGWISLSKKFYNVDLAPSIVIANGKINRKALIENKMNIPFLYSELRKKGYANIADVEFAIVEPDGTVSVLPKSQNRPMQPKDLAMPTQYEGIALPLIIDGEIQYNNLKYAKLTVDWLNTEIGKAGAAKPEEVFLAEFNSMGELYVDFYKDNEDYKVPTVF